MVLGGGAATTTAHEKLLGNLLVAEPIKTTPLIGFNLLLLLLFLLLG
jgi:hypothetical protein